MQGGSPPIPSLGMEVPASPAAAPPSGLVLAVPTQSAPYIRGGAALSGTVSTQRVTQYQVAAPAASPASASAAVSAAPAPAPDGAAPASSTPAITDGPRAALDLDDGGLRRSSAASSAPVASPTPTPTPAEPESVVVFHEVKAGDTLGAIAQRYGVSVRSILSINEVVQDRDMLKVGLQLYIPTADGVVTFVKWGDTITELAEKYGVKPETIVGYKPNKLSDADAIRQGELILIPGGKPPAPPAPPPAPAAVVAATPAPATRPAPAPASAPAPAAAPAAPAPAQARPATGGGWIWPISGALSSYFGPSHPLGIDIDLYGRGGAAIRAARGGVVTFAGGNPCCSYGYYVEIDHGDGYRTLYAHFSGPPPVRIGQTVSQGQVVGYAGSTGYSTGTHLHFEVRRGGTPVNPLSFLP